MISPRTTLRHLWISIILMSMLTLSESQARARWEGIADTVFFNLSSDAGLPFGRISGIARDRDGFMWMVTADGLIRWDGMQFQSLSSDIPDIDNDIRAIKADRSGRFWLGTGRGLRCFDPSDSAAHLFPLLADDTFAVLAIELEYRSSGLVLWLGTERGVFEVDLSTDTVTQHLKDLSDRDRTMRVFTVLRDANGDIWVGTSKGVYRKSNTSDEFEHFDLGATLDPETRIADMLQTASGEIWVGTPRDGVFLINTDGHVKPVVIPDFENEWIYALSEVSPDVIWLGTYGRGIIEVARADHSVRRIQNNPLLKNSLADDQVWTIEREDNGLIWVGTAQGLSVHDFAQQSVLTLFGGSGRELGLRDREVKSLLETQQGEILVGLRSSGVDVLDPVSGRVDAITVDASRPSVSLPGGAIEAMAQSVSGDIYIGSNWGLYRLGNDTLNRVQFDIRAEDIFTGSLLYVGDELWAGGTDGLWRFNMDQVPAISTRITDSISGVFTDPRVSTLAGRPNGGLVVGTWEGINWVDSTGALEDRIPTLGQTRSPLDNGYITSILHDQSGRTWLGTSGAGIYVRSDQGLQQITRQQGLPSDMTGSLQIDSQGRIWASSNGGIAVIDSASLAVTNLGPADGAMVAPYYRQPGLTTANGEILFGGESGLTVIKPEDWQPNTAHAPLAITALRVGDVVEMDRAKGMAYDEPVIIPADTNAISVEYAALDFLAARSIQYRHRLVDFDRDWRVSSADRRTATYTSLPPGQYVLEIQASNRQGVWGAETKGIFLQVLPYWYQTQWARWLGILGIMGLFMVLFRWRTAQLRHDQDALEQLIRERTRDLEISSQALLKKSEELETASVTDPLTGMHNRRFLTKYMPADQAIVLRRYRDVDVGPIEMADLLFFVVDIDHFKRVNDVHGHSAGDEVLKAMRHRLSQVFRESDYLVRWGGEEFLVVARNASRTHCSEVAERIRLQVQDTPFDAGHGVVINKTCSIGYSALPFNLQQPDAVDWLDCVRLADLALYAAKRAGRNAWVGITAGPKVDSDALMKQIVIDPVSAIRNEQIQFVSNLDPQVVREAWLASDLRH